jgi:hypothetical protein
MGIGDMTVIFSSEAQQNSEIAYAEWLAKNPKGFVLNCLKAASGIPTKNDEIRLSSISLFHFHQTAERRFYNGLLFEVVRQHL